MDITASIKELRKHLHLSQQEFAQVLGSSIRAVVNYEGGRVPERDALLALIETAERANRTDLAAVFQTGLQGASRDQMENAFTPIALNGSLPFKSETEWLYMRAVQWILQDGRFQYLKPKLEDALVPVIEHLNKLGKDRKSKAKLLAAKFDAYNKQIEEKPKRKKKES